MPLKSHPHPLTAEFAAADPQQCTSWANSFAEHLGLEPFTIELVEIERFVIVWRCFDSETGVPFGWIIGGNIPFLFLNDRRGQMTAAIEAIAMYALGLFLWLEAQSGRLDPEEAPTYLCPPDWCPADYAESRLGAITGFMRLGAGEAEPRTNPCSRDTGRVLA